MPHRVPASAASRNPAPRSYTARELDLMMVASSALLGGRAPNLTADELAEAGQLLENLEPDDDPHPAGCGCWRCDDSYAYHDEGERFDMARDLADDRSCS